MKITNVTTAVLEANFDWTIVKIETDTPHTGYGEAFLGPALPHVIAEFKPVLLGEDPTNFERLLRRMRGAVAYTSPGLVFHAIGGLETALLDLIGKAHNMPVWQLLGGKYRDRVPVYADCHGGDALESITPLLMPRTPAWMKAQGADEPTSHRIVSLKHHGWDTTRDEVHTPQAYAERAAEMAQRGFPILKFDVDVPTPYETDEYNRDLSNLEVEYAAELVRAVRRAVPRETELAIDCHWNYNVRSAIALAQAIEDVKLVWLEDPIPQENIPAFREIQQATRTTIATGENNFFRIEFDRLIREGGLRVLAPDVQKLGLWEGKKLADLADMHYVNLTWHNISGPIGTIAGVHLCAASPNLIALEWHAASVPFFDSLIDRPLIENGRVTVPDAPGLGVTFNPDAAYPYRKPGEAFFE